ncbi:hypothetical protein NP233_g5854 [Leucocoprinus birnbaumii]|uniref:Uncharacterized protein n=1 Tax=Leucocoprinus birnbaumii TaxID=56174 RepID=A0AAD5VS22_9AGAR|nr:hypothetical protein NP233_g5854 [Leucocoprinus birnbaumii]
MKDLMYYGQKHMAMLRWHAKRSPKAKAARGSTLGKGGKGESPSLRMHSSPPPPFEDIPMSPTNGVNPSLSDREPGTPQWVGGQHSAMSMHSPAQAYSPEARPDANEDTAVGSPVPSHPYPPSTGSSSISLTPAPSFTFERQLVTIPRPMTTPPTSQGSAMALISAPSPFIHPLAPVAFIPKQVPQLSEYRVEEVEVFLGACQPDMRFLLRSFMTYGCRSNETLRMVAKLPDAEIDEVLKEVVGIDPELLNNLPRLELYLLRSHLKAYFSR